ncbi:MAG: hypothetical protein JWN72_444, partial [Thermoleophilia bacterium]|nr:hypothetical protein [Thermoleophilia bacterium]
MTTHARIPATAPSLTQRPAFVLPRFELPPPAVAGSPPPVPVLPSPQPCRAPAPPATTMLEQVQADSPAETAAAAASALHAPATQLRAAVSKLPAITLSFWVLKMAATTLGETGGDQISESMHVGYLATFALFMAIFLAAVTTQVRSGQLRPGLFWTVIVATSAAGTEMADFLFETIGIGVISGAMALIAPIVLIVLLGRTTGGSFSVTDITTRRDEVLYWATILTTNTIGTGLGDGLTAGI